MLALREVLPPHCCQCFCTLVLEDGNSSATVVILTAVNTTVSVIYADKNSVSHSDHVIDLGSTVLCMVGLQHQCFFAWTECGGLYLIRYQANLAPPSSLPNDTDTPFRFSSYRHWVILQRHTLLREKDIKLRKPCFTLALSRNVVLAALYNNLLHRIYIDFDAMSASSGEFASCWRMENQEGFSVEESRIIAGHPGSKETREERYARIKKDWRECSADVADEEMLNDFSVLELAEWKHTCEHRLSSRPTLQNFKTPLLYIRHSTVIQPFDKKIHLMKAMGKEGFIRTDGRRLHGYSRAFPTLKTENDPRNFGIPLKKHVCYLANITTEERLTILTGGSHIRFMSGELNCASLCISEPGKIDGFIVRCDNSSFRLKEAWLMLEDGSLVCVPLKLTGDDCAGTENDDCVGTPYPRVTIKGLPKGFYSRGFRPLYWDPISGDALDITDRLAVVSDGVNEVYVVDLISRSVVGEVYSGAPLSSVCTLEDGDLCTASLRGNITRYSPVCELPGRYSPLPETRDGISYGTIIGDGNKYVLVLSSKWKTILFHVGPTVDGFYLSEIAEDIAFKGWERDTQTLAASFHGGNFVQCTTYAVMFGNSRREPISLIHCATFLQFEDKWMLITASERELTLYRVATTGITALKRCPLDPPVNSWSEILLAADFIAETEEIVVACGYNDRFPPLRLFKQSEEDGYCTVTTCGTVSVPLCGQIRSLVSCPQQGEKGVGFMAFYKAEDTIVHLSWCRENGIEYEYHSLGKAVHHMCSSGPDGISFVYPTILLRQGFVDLFGVSDRRFHSVRITPSGVHTVWQWSCSHLELKLLVLCDAHGVWIGGLGPVVDEYPLCSPPTLLPTHSRQLPINKSDSLIEMFYLESTDSLLCLVSNSKCTRLFLLNGITFETTDSITVSKNDTHCFCAKKMPSSNQNPLFDYVVLSLFDTSNKEGKFSVFCINRYIQEISTTKAPGCVMDFTFYFEKEEVFLLAACAPLLCAYRVLSSDLFPVTIFDTGVSCVSIAVTGSVVSTGMETGSHLYFSFRHSTFTYLASDFSPVYSQTVYANCLVREINGNVTLSAVHQTRNPSSTDLPVVGVTGVLDLCVQHSFRLPSRCTRVVVLPTPFHLLPRTKSFQWGGKQTTLNWNSETLFFCCEDGSLYSARKVPYAFYGPLSRLTQCVSDISPFSLAIRPNGEVRTRIKQLYRTQHQQKTQLIKYDLHILRPQGTIDMRVLEEFNAIRSPLIEKMNIADRELVEQKRTAIVRLAAEKLFQEYGEDLTLSTCIQIANSL